MVGGFLSRQSRGHTRVHLAGLRDAALTARIQGSTSLDKLKIALQLREEYALELVHMLPFRSDGKWPTGMVVKQGSGERR